MKSFAIFIIHAMGFRNKAGGASFQTMGIIDETVRFIKEHGIENPLLVFTGGNDPSWNMKGADPDVQSEASVAKDYFIEKYGDSGIDWIIEERSQRTAGNIGCGFEEFKRRFPEASIEALYLCSIKEQLDRGIWLAENDRRLREIIPKNVPIRPLYPNPGEMVWEKEAVPEFHWSRKRFVFRNTIAFLHHKIFNLFHMEIPW